MTKILASSEAEINDINRLLEKSVPTYRQAYSDRTAWIMACLAELAYIRFNPLFSHAKHKDYFLENLARLVDEQKKS